MVTIPSERVLTTLQNLAYLQCADDLPQVDVPPGATIDPVATASLTVHQLDKLRIVRWSALEVVRSRDGHSQNSCSGHTIAHCHTSSMSHLSARIQKHGAVHGAVLVEALAECTENGVPVCGVGPSTTSICSDYKHSSTVLCSCDFRGATYKHTILSVETMVMLIMASGSYALTDSNSGLLPVTATGRFCLKEHQICGATDACISSTCSVESIVRLQTPFPVCS